jgi:galactose mutarotase-like enzyme
MMSAMEVVTLGSGSQLEARFVPEAGMVGCSLLHRGDELLGQRRGLEAYVERGKTMGIPLLYPWANRLSTERFELAGREVVLDDAPSRDPNGLPIHGLLAAAGGWRVEHADGERLSAAFDFTERRGFPFTHTLRYHARLSGSKLSITLTVVAGSGAPVPISFGFHPYLQLPDVARRDWQIEAPVRERLVLDDKGIPTGERAPAEIEPGQLGERTFDDAFTAPPDGAPFVLAGGGRTIELKFEGGYSYSQVFAPPEDDVIAFEPMTAPTNALVTGELRVLEPGDEYEASFAIEVG